MATQSTTTFSDSVFAVEVSNHELLKLAYDSYLAAGRLSSANTKTRGEVRGGGKKPWKQKGTGRARFGSSRNPIWRGGGIVFGPQGNENYRLRLSTTQKRVALRQALTLAKSAGKIVVSDVATTGKTREIADYLKKNELADTRRVLIVVDAKTPEMIRATRNVPTVELLSAMYLSVFHILNADKIIIAPAALKTIEVWLTKQDPTNKAAATTASEGEAK